MINSHVAPKNKKKIKKIVYTVSLHNKLFNLPARGTCANGIFTSPPYQDNFVQGLDQRLKLIGSVGFEMYGCT